MSATKTVPEHRRYEIIAYGRGEIPLYYEEFGSYQGSWVMIAKGAEGFSLYRGSYGSCSGCDSYEAEVSSYDGVTLEQAQKFAADYTPFLVIPGATMQNLCRERTLSEVMPANLREYDSDFPANGALAAAFMTAIKLAEGWPLELADVTVENQELRQRALRTFGYDRWIQESGGTVIHRDGADELVKAGDMMFVHVKDASTDRRYLLRVPPTMRRVREAIAWTFGMGEADYRPVRET